MAIKDQSVNPRAIRLRSPVGLFYDATAVVYTSASGLAVFDLQKAFVPIDDGLWEIYSSIDNRISDNAGNLVISNQKIGEVFVNSAKIDTDVAIKNLSDAIALLPTNATLAPIKADIAKIFNDAAGFASKSDLATTNAAVTTVSDALKQYQASVTPTTLKALQDAVAQANIDIAALKKRQDDLADALQKATQAIADLAIIVAKGITNAASEALVLSLQTRLDALDKSKADKVSLDALTVTVTALNTAIAATATDKELTDAIASVDKAIVTLEVAQKAADDALAAKIKTNAENIQKNKDAILELQKKAVAVIRYTADGVVSDVDHKAIVMGKIALKLPKVTLDRFIEFEILDAGATLTAETGEQFFVFDGEKVVASDDGQGTLDAAYSQVILIGRVTGGWDAISSGSGGGSSASTVETIILPLLPAGVWTALPTTKTINDWQVRTSGGSYVTDSFQYRRNGVSLEVLSLVAFNDLQFTFEAASPGSSKQETVILPLLPANVWTAISSTKPVIDWQVESSTGQVLTDSFDYRNIGGNLEVFSLVQFNNLQFILEE